jgi:hypothetical protein
MATRSPPAQPLTLETIKRLAIQAVFLDEAFEEQLVLKGGAALALVHGLNARESVDVDFSMADDFDEWKAAGQRLEIALRRLYAIEKLELLDFQMERKPDRVSADLAGFWGGYKIEFKLVPAALFEAHREQTEQLRRDAMQLGQSKRFLIDISPFEFVEGKVERDLGGVSIFVYTPLMMVCEKLRAICQQHPRYHEIVRRSRPDGARPRDLFDITELIDAFGLDVASEEGAAILQAMFACKKVPIDLLERIGELREAHRIGFVSLKDTVSASTELLTFGHYFERVVRVAHEALAAVRRL